MAVSVSMRAYGVALAVGLVLCVPVAAGMLGGPAPVPPTPLATAAPDGVDPDWAPLSQPERVDGTLEVLREAAGDDVRRATFSRTGSALAVAVDRRGGGVLAYASAASDWSLRDSVGAIPEDRVGSVAPAGSANLFAFTAIDQRTQTRRLFYNAPGTAKPSPVLGERQLMGSIEQVSVDRSGGRMAFVWEDDIYTFEPATGLTEKVALTRDKAERNPTIRGGRVAWDVDGVVMESSGGGASPVEGLGGVMSRPAWAGGVLVWFEEREGRTDLVASLHGTPASLVASGVRMPTTGGPAVTADGVIAVVLETDPDTVLLTLPDRSWSDRVQSGVGPVRDPAVASIPDGWVRLAMVTDREGLSGLYLLDLPGPDAVSGEGVQAP